MQQDQQGSATPQSTEKKSIEADVETLKRLVLKPSSPDARDTQSDERQELQARYGIVDAEISPILLVVRGGCSDEYLTDLLARRQAHLVS